jgi:putative flippase GtrA
LEGRADAVFGSRYLRPSSHRALYFWHSLMNRALTCASNMCTNLDITDMETCYKLFGRDLIAKIAPTLQENRFGFEPEVTAKIAQSGARLYECAIDYSPRSYEEGKKIGWKDGVRALYCILHYSANTAPLPMQLLIYLFIGAVSLCMNVASFCALHSLSLPWTAQIVGAYFASTLLNYLLCIAILFRHKARWKGFDEFIVYLVVVLAMGLVDYALMDAIHAAGIGSVISKTLAAGVGFVLNFALRRWIVFPEKRA